MPYVSRSCCALAAGAAALACAALAAHLGAPVSDDHWLQRRLLADAADGQLDDMDFLSAALVASGVEDAAELKRWRDWYQALRDEILASCRELPNGERSAAICALVHERILKGRYQPTASDLRLALQRGDYNCLSALALYWDLHRAAGIQVEIGAVSGHVFLREVETGAVVEPVAEAGGMAASAAPWSGGARSIGPVELLGRFYYNRGVLALEAGDFAAGIALLRTSLMLDPHDGDARENLLAGLNNWAVEHCQDGRYDLAQGLIDEGLRVDAAFAPLLANQRFVRGMLAL